MNYLAATSLAAVTANVCLGVFVFLYRRTRPANRIFFAFSLALAIWGLAIFTLAGPVGHGAAVHASRLMVYACLLASALFLHLTLRIVERKARTALYTSYVSAALLIAADFGGLMITGAREIELGSDVRVWFGNAGPLAPLVIVYTLAVTGLALVHLYRVANTTTGIRRAQAQYLGVAIVAPTLIGLHDLGGLYFTTYPLTSVPFSPLFPLGSLFWASLAAYTMLRYRLIDLDAAIARGMSVALMLVVLGSPAAAAVLALEHAQFGRVHADFTLFVFAVIGLCIVLAPRVRRLTEGTVEGVLLRRTGDYRSALFRFSRESARILDLRELVERLNSALLSALGVARASVYLAEATGVCRLAGAKERTGDDPEAVPVTLDAGDPVVEWLRATAAPVVREELELEGRPLARHVAQAMAAIGAEVALPLITPERFEGVVFLGPKRSGAMFTKEDMEVLTIFANQLAVSLENARLYADLKRSQELIQRSDRLSAIGTMAAGLAHEIRNPLVSIRTFTQLLPERIEDEEFRSKFLELTLSEVDRICALINELLAFARPAPAQLARIDLNACLEGICMLLESQARNRGIDLRMRLKPGLRPITVDEDQIKQVVMNVVLNAIQACGEKGVVTVSSYDTVVDGDAYLCIEVSDNGRGIEPELLKHIFDPFFTTRREGTGLGLSIAHQIVSRHGGFIDVKSQVGAGTTFFVHLPLHATPRHAQPSQVLDADDLRLNG